jgi:hypothetical protein
VGFLVFPFLGEDLNGHKAEKDGEEHDARGNTSDSGFWCFHGNWQELTNRNLHSCTLMYSALRAEEGELILGLIQYGTIMTKRGQDVNGRTGGGTTCPLFSRKVMSISQA